MISSAFLLPVILFPILSGALMQVFRIRSRRAVRIYTGIVTLLTSVFAWLLILRADDQAKVLLQFTRDFTFMLRFDALGRFFAGIIATLWPLTVCYAFEYLEDDPRQGVFFTWFTISYGVTLGISMAGNLFSLYIFYELLTLVTVPLVMHTGTRDAIRAARTYFGFSLGGAAFAMISMLYLTTGEPSIESATVTRIFYVIGVVGFGVKSAMFPLHIWLPKASVAPTPVTALLHAVAVVKAGVFSVIRLTYYGYGTELVKDSWAQYVLIGLAMFTILYGAVRAVKEVHWKRRLAYSTVANLSYILFGVLLMRGEGLVGALLHMAFHAEIKILAFFAAGAVLHRTGKTYIYEMDGLGRKMPWTLGCFTVSALALTGIPPMSGFISKWHLLTAAAAGNNAVSYIGAGTILLAALLTAMYMLSMAVRVWFPKKGADVEKNSAVREAGAFMLVPMVILALGILFTGLFPGVVIRSAELIAAAAKTVGGDF